MELKVQIRTDKQSPSSLREKGLVPCELYGRGFSNQSLTVLGKDFIKVFKEAGENTIINLREDKESWPVLVYDVQKDPLTGAIRHVDFYRVTMTEKIKSMVPLEFTGESIVVKEKRGVLNRAMNEIEVEALPADLPHRIEVDTNLLLEIDQSIYVRDLVVSPKVKLLVDQDTVVASAVPLQAEEVVVKPIDVSEVKAETDEKKAEREKSSDGETEK
jgi:large subunit ribosomal protein L25